MWRLGKGSFSTICLLCIVFALHKVRSDEATDSIMDAINKASKDLPGMKVNVMSGDDILAKQAASEDDNEDDSDNDEGLENVQEIKLDSVNANGQTIQLDSDGVVTESSAEANQEEEEDIDETQLDGYEVDNGVVVLQDETFSDFVVEKSKDSPVLVEFYAPWCGHCKNLAPEYEKAAKILKGLKNPVYLAKVDATEEKELAQKYDVNGYPTLKWFRNGVDYEYDGPREANGIVEYMKERSAADWKPPPVAVVTLTSENFTDFVNGNDLSLVEFYAPWCGHCKKLAPQYEKAAQQLKDNDPPIPLAKVDATAETDLGQQFDVSGYPTLKIFRRGVPYEYKGEKDEFSIVRYMQGQQGDPSKEVKSRKELEKALAVDDVTVVGFFKEEDLSYKAYSEAVNDIRDDYTLLHTFDADAREQYKASPGSVMVFQAERFFTKYEEPRRTLQLTDDTQAREVVDFITANNKPLVGEYTSPSKRYTERPLLLFFYTVDFSFDGRTATQLWRNKIAKIANDYKGKLTFAIADEDKNKDLFKQFGFEDSGEEMNVGVLGEDDRKFPMEPEEFDEDTIKDFIKSYLKGKAKAIVKSQPVPKKNKGPVKVVVGNSFEKIVLDPTKNVLLEMYAPWCGHCKKLEPTYKELAKKMKPYKDLVIAKMDATANDAPPEFKAEGFPTIYYSEVGKKSSPTKYTGGRELVDFEKFFEEKGILPKSEDVKEEL